MEMQPHKQPAASLMLVLVLLANMPYNTAIEDKQSMIMTAAKAATVYLTNTATATAAATVYLTNTATATAAKAATVYLTNTATATVATAAFGAAAAIAAMAYTPISCYFKECCRPYWISFNKTGLEADLKLKLFGQHIASRVIVKAVSGFMNDDKRKKPLVLSLHGWTGTGKTFVSKLIAENIYKEGASSKFIHYFNPRHHFPHASHIDTYKSQLQDQIRDGVISCETSMFIFDEVDKMSPDLIDSFTSFLDYYDKLDGISYRKAIFIFISNAGGDGIVNTTLDFWKSGRDREKIELKDLEKNLSEALTNNKQSGHGGLVVKNLVDFFVPFLPLEKQHVVLCAKAVMKDKGIPAQYVADKLAKDRGYFPENEKVFSLTGCLQYKSS